MRWLGEEEYTPSENIIWCIFALFTITEKVRCVECPLFCYSDFMRLQEYHAKWTSDFLRCVEYHAK